MFTSNAVIKHPDYDTNFDFDIALVSFMLHAKEDEMYKYAYLCLNVLKFRPGLLLSVKS